MSIMGIVSYYIHMQSFLCGCMLRYTFVCKLFVTGSYSYTYYVKASNISHFRHIQMCEELLKLHRNLVGGAH